MKHELQGQFNIEDKHDFTHLDYVYQLNANGQVSAARRYFKELSNKALVQLLKHHRTSFSELVSESIDTEILTRMK